MRLTIVFSVFLIWGTSLFANEKVEQLASALKLAQVMEILASEGQQQRRELDETLLSNTGGAFFKTQVEQIYDPVWMKGEIIDAFSRGMTDAQLDQAILFFESDLGQTIIALENSARQAMSDDTIEEMANETYRNTARDSVLFELVDEYIEVNDLVEQNVHGSLSSDYNFFRGLDVDGVTDDQELLSQLLSQKDSMTADTKTWLYSFLLLAYQPLNESQMRENIAFSRTETGRALNAALFDGFDTMFDRISFRLGETVAQVLRGSDL